MGTYDELAKLDSGSPIQSRSRSKPRREKGTIGQSTDRSTDRLTKQSTNRPIDQPINWPIKVEELGPVVGRPRAFYVTQKVDAWLDESVRYIRSKDIHKVDRSIVVNTLLHTPDFFEPAALDKLRKRLLAHLTNKSLSRTQSTD